MKLNLLKLENSIKNKILEPKNLIKVFMMIIIFISILIRIAMLKYQSEDYISFLEKWFYKIKELGGFAALKENIGDYNVPYMCIMAALTYIPISPLITIKTVSIIFDFIGAIFCALLVYEILKEKRNSKIIACVTFCIILLLPTIFINSALWGQCDIIYVTFIIMSLYLLYKDKTILSFICLGVSFAFKLQFIFILPLYALLYFKREDISIAHFFIIPLTNFLLCLPAIIAGRKISDCILIYFNQTGTYKDLTANYPNLYNIFGEFFENQTIVLVILTVAIVAMLMFFFLYKKIQIKENIVRIALILSVSMVFFLPRMHERYGFLPEILSVLYVIIYKKDYYFPIVLQFSTLYTYHVFLSGNWDNYEIFINIVSIIQFISIIKFTIDNTLFLNNEEESRCAENNLEVIGKNE